MLIHNHLNLTGNREDIRIVGDVFLWPRPFNSLVPEPDFEGKQEAIKHWRMKHWGVPYEPVDVNIIDAFDHSVSLEFVTVGTEPGQWLRYVARFYPSLSGVCQFMADAHQLHNSGVVRISNGKTFTRTYSKPADLDKEYA